MKLFLFLNKFLFLISASFFGFAVLIQDSWIPELLASLSVFHAVSTFFFIILFAVLKCKNWTIYSLALLFVQSIFLVNSYFHSDQLVKSCDAESVKILQYNVHYLNPEVAEIVDWLEDQESQHDIIFLQEVNMNMKNELKRLETHYPYQVIMPSNSFFGRAFLSKIPIIFYDVKKYNNSRGNYIVINMKTPQGKDLRFYGVHTLAPVSPTYLEIRNREFEEINQIISQDTSPHVILSGDFNTTPYSGTFRKTLEKTGLKCPRCITASWPADMSIPHILRLQLDHLLVSKKIDYISQKTGIHIGSDHFPVITHLSLRD